MAEHLANARSSHRHPNPVINPTTMTTTYPIIPRPSYMAPVRVLEVDGPRRKYVQRGEGSYYLATDNHPHITDFMHPGTEPVDLNRFKDWSEPCWSIYQYHDGTVKITADRPSPDEAAEGDLHGQHGSSIILRSRTREAIRNGLRVARRLCRCSTDGIFLNRHHLNGIVEITTLIPIRLL
jgi:hypothetical protein